jgi:dihydrofolate reductase
MTSATASSSLRPWTSWGRSSRVGAPTTSRFRGGGRTARRVLLGFRLFVVTHAEPEGGVYTFVDGIPRALERAKVAAGDKDVAVMGGADIGQQFIRAGLIDEISIHLVPVLFGGGTRMFEYLGGEHIRLETAGGIETPEATHLRFRVAE